MDDDLADLSRKQLMEEVRKLRRGIRAHRDTSGQELCWHHPGLWKLLPEQKDPFPRFPIGLSSSGAAFATDSLSTSNFPKLHVRRRNTTDSP